MWSKDDLIEDFKPSTGRYFHLKNRHGIQKINFTKRVLNAT